MADLDEDDENLSRVLAEVETLDPAPNPNPSSGPSLSEPTLASLLSLSSSPDVVALLFDRLSSLSLPISSLLSPLSSSMDSSSPSASLLASRAYLSLLLSPSSPLFSLFTPLSFLSLLRAVRRSVKSQSQGSSSPPSNPNNRRKRKGSDRSGRRVDHGGENMIEVVLELLNSVVKKVRLDVAHDGRKFLVETIITVLESGGNWAKVMNFL